MRVQVETGARIWRFVAAPRRLDAEARVVLRAVAAARAVAVEQLLHPQRCNKHVAGARQLAMYLVHTLLSRNYQDTGEVFGRDRTTVSHACAHIEDLREDRSFDEADIEVSRTEEPIRAAG